MFDNTLFEEIRDRVVTDIYMEGDIVWSAYEIKPETFPKVPGHSELFNFYVGPWLILDSYGNNLAKAAQVRLFGPGDVTLAVNKFDGRIAIMTAGCCNDMGGVDIYLTEIESVRLPLNCLDTLDQLLTKKRPFNIEIDSGTVLDLLDREATWEDCKENLIFRFNFKDGAIEVFGDKWRACSFWEVR